MTIEEIRDPGIKRRIEDEKNRKREEKLAKRRQRSVFGGAFDGSSDEEDEGMQGIWTPEEDEKLKEYFALYKDDNELLKKLKNVLDMDLNSERSERRIRKRLIELELMQAPKKRERRVTGRKSQKMPKKVKIDTVAPTIVNIVKKGKNDNETDSLNWLAEKLSDLSIVMNKDKEDLTIVPVEREDFDHLEKTSVGQIFGALHFRKPGPWFKIPYSYNRKEITKVIRLIRDNLDDQFDEDNGMDDSAVAALVAESTALIRNIAHSKVVDGEMIEQASPRINRTPKRGIKRPFDDSDSSEDEMQLQQLRKRGKKIIADSDED